MSDGDNATPARRRAADADADAHVAAQRLQRGPWPARPAPNAPPWERSAFAGRPVHPPVEQPVEDYPRNRGVPHSHGASDDYDDDYDDYDTGEESHSLEGNHADGVSVADLIAKLGGTTTTGRAARRRAEPDPEPAPPVPPSALPPRAPLKPPHVSSPALRSAPNLNAAPASPEAHSAHAGGASLQGAPVHGPGVPASVVNPDLPSLDWPDDEPEAEQTTQLAAVVSALRMPPVRIGDLPPAQAPAPKPSTRHHAVKIVGRIAVAMVSVLTLTLTGAAWQWSTEKNNLLNRVSALDPDSRDIVDPNAQFGDENFLIVGTDSRFGANGEMGAGDTEMAGGARSDTVMLVNIPANRERVVVVSFPRDLEIEPMKCDAWDASTGEYGPIWDANTGSYGPEELWTESKLNSAYAFGGPKCLVKVIQKLSGLSINRFMAVDFAGFAKMVDALGGVEVCVTEPLEDYELGTILPNVGRQTVDGNTALNYVRARQVTTEINGDYGRIKRQQLFLSSLLRSLISREVFFSLSKLNNVVNTFIGDSAVDNIDTEDLVQLGQSIQGLAAGRITFLTVPTTGYADEWGNENLRVDDTRALFDAIINDDPLPGENDSNETTSPTTAAASAPKSNAGSQTTTQPSDVHAGEVVNATTAEPDSVTVHVSNSTGQTGLGAVAADGLTSHGFNVLTPDDYPKSLSTTTVFFSAGNEQAAATVASAFVNPQIQQVSGMGDVVQVVLGSDFNDVGTMPPTGSPVRVHFTRSTDTTPTALPQDLSVTNAADTTCE